MKIDSKLLLIMVLIISFNMFSNNIANAYYPLEVSLTSQNSTYGTNEVVRWQVYISGGSTYGPDFDVYFTDSAGNSSWIRDLNKYSTTINSDYQKPGKVTANVTVYGVGGPVSDSKTITIQ